MPVRPRRWSSDREYSPHIRYERLPRSGLRCRSRAGANHNLEVLGSVENFVVDNVAADNESVGISHSIEQLLLFGIFFEESQFVAGAFNNFAYALYSPRDEGFQLLLIFSWCVV